jgi:hypothetical protein
MLSAFLNASRSRGVTVMKRVHESEPVRIFSTNLSEISQLDFQFSNLGNGGAQMNAYGVGSAEGWRPS